MRNAYKNLIKYALAQGHSISVYDGEEWALKRSRKFREVIAAIESVEVAEIRIRKSDGEKVAWAMIIPYGVSPEESVADFTDNEFMNTWLALFEGE